jgi:hypothetical protein
MLVDPTGAAREIFRHIKLGGRQAVLQGRTADGYRIETGGATIDLRPDECRLVSRGMAFSVTDAAALEHLHDLVADWLRAGAADAEKTQGPLPGVVRAEALAAAALDGLCSEGLRPAYAHEEIYGPYCFVADHIAAPYDDVFDYCANALSLAEWTVNIRALVPLGRGLFRGQMVFSAEDAAAPSTAIFIRADALRGADFGTICYPCAWDQGDDLWMRYYFVFADASKALGKPGTVVLWANCKHPYYDRGSAGVPAYVSDGRARTDRPWAGDGWPFFSSLHRLELRNLKTILERRFRRAE